MYWENESMNFKSKSMKDNIVHQDGLVIEGNTIYEIDLDCYACLNEREKDGAKRN